MNCVKLFCCSLFLLLLIPYQGFSQQRINEARLVFPRNVTEIQIPFERINGWVVIKGQINNTEEKTFILDTGAPIAVLVNDTGIASLQLKINGNINVGGGDGNAAKKVPLATSVSIKFGTLLVENAAMAIGAAKDAVYGVDGIIGKYFFEGATVKINWQNKLITIYKTESFKYEGNGTQLPLHIAPTGHIYTMAQLTNGDTAIQIKALVDLGNKSVFFIDKKHSDFVANNNKAVKNLIIGWGANGPVYGSISRSTINLQEIMLGNVVTGLKESGDRLSASGLAGNIGLSILERFTIYIDYNGGKLILEKNADFGRPFTFNRSGIIINPLPDEEGFQIAQIIPGSAAETAGLMKGDKIITIDGLNFLKMNFSIGEQLLKGFLGEKIQTEIKREGIIYRFIINMKDII